MNDQVIQELLQYYNEMKQERAPWEGLWRETSQYTLPTSQFNNTAQPGRALTEQLYDGTSIKAANRLAAELLGMAVNPNDRNFEFHPIDPRKLHDSKMKAFTQYLSDGVQYLLHCPEYRFYTAAHEMLVEYVRFGQGQMLIERVGDRPRYLACPLSQVYTSLDHDRIVNSVIRSWRLTIRQLRSMFPPEKYPWPAELTAKLGNPQMMSNKVEICHGVIPSEDHPQLANLAIFPKKWTHVIFMPDTKHIFEVRGLEVFPYAVPRYMMMSEETYGRGPGTFSLPDTKMVNSMEKTNIRAFQKFADPPLLLPRRGWLKPIDVSPSALNYYDGLEEAKIQSFGIDGNPQMAEEFVNQHRASILEMYQVDQLEGSNKRAEMKEVEVLDDQEQRMRAMAPQLARIYTEWISVTVNLLLYYFSDELIQAYDGDLPDEFANTGRLDLRVKYTSPLQRAQSMLDASNVKRVLDNFWIPVTQLDPTLGARFSGDGFTDWLVDNFNLPVKLILPKEEAQAKIQQAQQQQQAQQMTGTAVDASQAMKNMAQAQQALPQPVPGQGVA